MATVRASQSLRLGDLQQPIEQYLAAITTPAANVKLQMGPLLKRWIAIGLAHDVGQLAPAKRKGIKMPIPTEQESAT